MPIERAIAEFRFAFGRNAQQMQMSPPPNSLLLNQVPVILADAFEKAFNREASTGAARPTALEWLSVLNQTKAELKRCSLHQAHMYFFRLANCPWCPIEDRGIILFIDVDASLKPGLDVESLWKTLQSLQLTSLPPIPTAYNRKISVAALPECIATGIRRRVGIGAGIAAIIATVWAVTVFTLPAFVALALVVVSVAFAYWLPQSAQKQRLARRGALNESQRKYRDLQNRYASECGEQPFISRVQELDQLRSTYNGLPLERQRKLRELESRREQLQLYHFLDQFSIHDASIPGIGIGRKQMLASYGVDSAADIDNQKLSSVPGFGPKMQSRLIGWRSSLERRFRFDPNKAVDRIEIQIIEQEIQSRRSQLEQSISNGVQAATAMHAAISSRRSNYIAQIEVSFKELMQAEKNYKAC
jgi:DNA-binding helix-hairpin-helix protein with protein kinase domain